MFLNSTYTHEKANKYKKSYTLDTPVKILMFWCTKKYKNKSAKIKQ